MSFTSAFFLLVDFSAFCTKEVLFIQKGNRENMTPVVISYNEESSMILNIQILYKSIRWEHFYTEC